MKFIFIGTAVISAALGAVGGYALAVRRLNDQYNAMMEEELERTRAHYENRPKFSTPEEAVKVLHPELTEEEEKANAVEARKGATDISEEDLARVLNGLKYNKITPAKERLKPETKVIEMTVPPSKAPLVRHVFGDVLDAEHDPEYETMIENRKHQSVYLVSQEEHLENPHDYVVETYTFYEGDQVLENEEGEISENYIDNRLGGKENLQFGRWSKDSNAVYIRNEEIGLECEVIRSTGKYSVEVLGLDDTAQVG